jgi:hypothetical protein
MTPDARQTELSGAKHQTLFIRLKKYSVGLLGVSFLSAFLSSFGATYFYEKFLPQEKKTIENNIKGKMSELEGAKVTLGNLIKFIDSQQASLHELSDNIEKMKREKREIEPILSLNREQARAVLASYESRINVWEERGWGFAIGLLTSVLGGFVLLYSSKIHFFKKKQSD